MNTLYLEKTGIHATLTTRSEADLLDSEAKTAALKYRTKKEWRITDPSTYARAARWRRWRKDDWRECTGHMILVKARHPGTNYCPLRYTDDRILSSARNFYTRTQWEKGDRPCYNAARRRLLSNPNLWVEATKHMKAARYGPYLGSYYVYGCFFDCDHTCYIGLSCRAESVRLREHAIKEGRVFQHSQEIGASFRWVVLERSLATPELAGASEAKWYDQFLNAGWFMLSHRSRCGNLGFTQRKLTLSVVRKRAACFVTRTDFRLKSGSAYKIASKHGWLDDVCSHMLTENEVRRINKQQNRENSLPNQE